MAQQQQELAKVILQDPAVESLSSFIGADGTNTTLNSGRIQINLSRSTDRERQRRRCHPPAADRSWHEVQGIQLYMQPVQDLTVDDRVSRTQYQYTLEDPDQNELNDCGPTSFVDEAEDSCLSSRRGHRPADRRARGCRWSSTATPPRGWASRPPRSTTRSTTPSASARSTPSTRS